MENSSCPRTLRPSLAAVEAILFSYWSCSSFSWKQKEERKEETHSETKESAKEREGEEEGGGGSHRLQATANWIRPRGWWREQEDYEGQIVTYTTLLEQFIAECAI